MSLDDLTFDLLTLNTGCLTIFYIKSLFIIEKIRQCKISGAGGIRAFQYFPVFLSWFRSLSPKEMKKEFCCESTEK